MYYSAINLSVFVLYMSVKLLSHTEEETWLKVFENRVQRTVLGPSGLEKTA